MKGAQNITFFPVCLMFYFTEFQCFLFLLFLPHSVSDVYTQRVKRLLLLLYVIVVVVIFCYFEMQNYEEKFCWFKIINFLKKTQKNKNYQSSQKFHQDLNLEVFMQSLRILQIFKILYMNACKTSFYEKSQKLNFNLFNFLKNHIRQ